MALRPLHICSKPGCTALTRDKYCDQHQKDGTKKANKKRATPNDRGYTYRWRKAAKGFLREHPWCAECQRRGRALTPATEVDHIIPHRGNKALFWDKNNWQPLCHRCHSRKTAREDGGFGNQSGHPPTLIKFQTP